MQSLTGLCQLLEYTGLLDAQLSFDIEIPIELDNAESNSVPTNYFKICSLLWHSLWINRNYNDATEVQEQEKTIEVFSLLSKADSNVSKWLFHSIYETLNEKKNSNTIEMPFKNSLNIIQHLCLLESKRVSTDESKAKTTSEHLLNIFTQIFNNILDKNDEISRDCCLNLLKSFNYLIKKLNCSLEGKEITIHCLLQLLLNEKQQNIFSDFEIVYKISSILSDYSLFLKPNNPTKQFLQKINEMFAPIIDEPSQVSSIKFIVIMQIYCSLNKKDFKDEVETFFVKNESKIYTIAIESDQNELNLLNCQFYASFINKLDDNSSFFNQKLDHLHSTLTNQVENKQLDKTKRLKCLQLWTWLTKALVLREHSKFLIFTNKLIQWLDDNDLTLNKTSSQAFSIILQDNKNESDCFMANKTAYNIKMFHRQRFFQSVINELKLKFDSENNKSKKTFYMMAVLNMVTFLPKDIIQKELKQVNLTFYNLIKVLRF
jgi:hypothetical protein